MDRNRHGERMEAGKYGVARRKLYCMVSVCFLLLFAVCIVWLILYLKGNAESEAELSALRETYVQEEAEGELRKGDTQNTGTEDLQTIPDSDGDSDRKEKTPEEDLDEAVDYEEPAKSIDFEALKEKNEDIYAWITVPGTKIDYPVLQHETEPDYYLTHNLDHSSGYPGCIYSQLYNSRDWDDPHTVLYGHNMKNGSMFASLHYYEDSEFFEENPYIYIYSEDGIRVYQIFAAYEFTNAHLLLTFDTNNPETFGAYLEGILSRDGIHDNFNRELELNAEDRLLTLSTCISNKPDNRYLVQAVLIAEP